MNGIKSILGKIYNKNVKFFDLGIIAVLLSLFLLLLGQLIGEWILYSILQKPIANDESGFLK